MLVYLSFSAYGSSEEEAYAQSGECYCFCDFHGVIFCKFKQYTPKTAIFGEANRISMAQETERKFLVGGDYKSEAFKSVRITQGYLCSAPERTVRVRIKGEKGFITVKGAGNASGVSRFEWEKEIPADEAAELLRLAEPGVIDKTRWLVKNSDGVHVWEVDEFHGDNEGLTLAEIELQNEDDPFDKPSWLGEEVTGDLKYYNSALARRPFKDWSL